MENIKRYYGADGNDKVLPWILYRLIEAEPFNSNIILPIERV